VIHISTPGPVGAVGMLAAKMLRVPVVGTYHTDFPAYIDHLFDDPSFTYLSARFMSFFYRPFAAVFSRSDEYAESLTRLGIDRTRIVRLLPGIDTDAFDTCFRDMSVWGRLGVPAEGPKVLYCGRVSVEKNLPFLAKVWKQVARAVQARGAAGGSCGAPQLVIVGDGPYREQMEQELAGTNAHFVGFRHGLELSMIYASSDLFVFPSTTDTLGQVVMESQASGLPVIVTDQGGPREVVQDGRTGLVLPADNARAWADAILRLADDEEMRARMGAAAHEAIRPMSIGRSFEHYWSVHERAARGEPAEAAEVDGLDARGRIAAGTTFSV
jgi:glycosyltransferase involved in cell wall biosynthesis